MKTLPFDFAESEYTLAPATFYRIGGAARIALRPRTRDEAVAAWQWMARQPGPKLVLGAGSNVLISDDGFPGIVLFTGQLDQCEALGGDRYRVQCGVPLGHLVESVLVPENYTATGALTGIPGTVGGAIFMNAGTVNGSMCQWLAEVQIAGVEGPRTVQVAPELYTYRGQRFCGPDELILEGTFSFERGAEDQRAIYDHYWERRRTRQPRGRCCGSVFKNPPGDHAGRLIEACGLKGRRLGGAQISLLHANFIMNEGTASFSDIIGLIELCKQTVFERFGIQLEEEVRIIGPDRQPPPG